MSMKQRQQKSLFITYCRRKYIYSAFETLLNERKLKNYDLCFTLFHVVFQEWVHRWISTSELSEKLI